MIFLKKYKKEITKVITKQLEILKTPEMSISLSIQEKLLPFTTAGKFVRGSLICAVHDMYKGNKNELAFQAAAATELTQSMILIIDDMIDQDSMRRGLMTIHKNFEKDLQDEHHGRSMAMCLGLISGFQSISLLKNQPPEILDLVGHELSMCGFGEMQELVYSLKKEATIEEVLAVYKYKTASYTFSLPMSIGAILAEVPKDEVQKLHKLGEHLGLLFQIRDDMLDELDPNITGKSQSDANNDTQTAIKILGEEKTKIMIEEQQKLAKEIIKTLQVKKPFLDILKYIMTRKK